MRAPLLILNIQINESETESLQIYDLSDVKQKLSLFCKNYNIIDKKTVARMKTRVLVTLKDKYPFLVIKEPKPIAATYQNRKTLFSSKVPQPDRHRRMKNLTIDTNIVKVETASGVNTKRGDRLTHMIPTTCHRNSRMTQSFLGVVKPSVTSKAKAKENNKENAPRHIRQLTDDTIPNRPLAETIFGNDVARYYMMTDLQNRIGSPQNSVNVSMMSPYAQKTPFVFSRANQNKITSEPKQEVGSEKQLITFNSPKILYKASFNEPVHQHEPQTGNLYDSCIQFQSGRLKNPQIENPKINVKTIGGFDRDLAKPYLWTVFKQLDADGSGYISPRNINLQGLNADTLKMLKNVVIEVFKLGQDEGLNFVEFCDIAENQTNLNY